MCVVCGGVKINISSTTNPIIIQGNLVLIRSSLQIIQLHGVNTITIIVIALGGRRIERERERFDRDSK
jgi:hypothetical protein